MRRRVCHVGRDEIEQEREMNTAELVQHEVEVLPEGEQQEVLDFIAFLKERHEREEWKNLMAAQQGSLAAVWENDEDEVWNHV